MEHYDVIIIGGGFGGLNAAQSLKSFDGEVLLVDRLNHHLFQPLLYQVASAALSPGNIAVPIRDILRNQLNTTVIMGEVTNVDKPKKEIELNDGDRYSYDSLIVATGARHSYFGKDEWEEFAPGLKSLNDAIKIREDVLAAFEEAEKSDDQELVKKLLRFVVIGGGPTGVEMAGAIAEIAKESMFHNFRKIKPEHSEIYLIEGSDRILHAFPPELSLIAQKNLEDLGIKVMTHTKVSEVNADGVGYDDHFIHAANIIWAAGNAASPLLKTLDTDLDRAGRANVGPDLSIPGHPEIFVIGDAANAKGPDDQPLPGIAPVAIQQGQYVAGVIRNHTAPKDRKPFSYHDRGSLATIGKAHAVGLIKNFRVSGFLAWLIWSLIHITYLISFRNRILVMMQWFSCYITGDRKVRLIKTPMYKKGKK